MLIQLPVSWFMAEMQELLRCFEMGVVAARFTGLGPLIYSCVFWRARRAAAQPSLVT